MSTVPRSFIKEASKLLLQCRQNHPNTPLEYLPKPLNPLTKEHGYDIANSVVEDGNMKVAGFKVAATNKKVMEKYNINEPFFGRVFENDLIVEHAGGTFVSPKRFLRPKVEAEISFRLGKDLEPRGGTQRITRAEVIQSIQSAIPSIEIIDSRFSKDVPLFSSIADNANQGALVISKSETEISKLQLDNIKVKLMIDNAVIGNGISSEVLGDPVESLLWLVNALSARDIPLKRGHVVCTGAITQPTKIMAGDVIRAEYGDLGSLQFFFKEKQREW